MEDVCNSSWLGEEDFFDWWIDQNYVLNFVNLKRQLLQKSKDETKVLMAMGTERGLGGGLDSTVQPGEVEMPLILTNDAYYKKYPFFIVAYSVKNTSGYITNSFGYSRDLQFYDSKLVSDRPVNKYVSYSIEYVTEKDLGKSSTLFKGRVNEEVYKKETKRVALSQKRLLTILSKHPQLGEEQALALNEYVYQHREEVVKESIVRKIHKSNDIV